MKKNLLLTKPGFLLGIKGRGIKGENFINSPRAVRDGAGGCAQVPDYLAIRESAWDCRTGARRARASR